MNVSILAAEIAHRVPDLARDCAPNNEVMIAAIINRHMGVECTPPPPPPEPPKQVKTPICGICKRPFVRIAVNTWTMGCTCWFDNSVLTEVNPVP